MQINLNPTSERGASRDAVNRPRETLGDSHLISSDPRSRFGLVCDLLCCRGNMTTKGRPTHARKDEAKASTSPFPLTQELKTYEAHLPGWADRQGQFVLIRGRDVLGFYPCHDDALEAGYDQLGSGPFLVKQILAYEPIYQLGQIEL